MADVEASITQSNVTGGEAPKDRVGVINALAMPSCLPQTSIHRKFRQ